MARRLRWRRQARADIAAIRAYIALSSPANAKKVVAEIERVADGLVHFPYANRMVPELQDPQRRETFVYAYRLMYRVEAGCVRILRVVHGRRLLVNVPGGFEEAPQAAYKAA